MHQSPAALVATFLAVLPAAAQVPDQLKFTIPNPSPGHGFGGSVAVSGTLVVVGARWHATVGSSVYVYDLSGATPTLPIATLNNPSPAGGDQFGFSVAISGSRVVVGDPSDDTGATDAGRAYVYDLAGPTPLTPVATLNNPSPAAEDLFGFSVAISGTRVVVGAPQDDTRVTQGGSVYVYDLTSAAPTVPVVTLDYPGAEGDYNKFFGWAVGIDGLRVVVGESMLLGDGLRTYVYDLGSATPTAPVARLGSSSRVGGSVAISGARVVVRARAKNGGGYRGAHVYDMNSATPTVPAVALNHLSPSTDSTNGFSVAISGSRVVVGTLNNLTGAGNAGSAYVYDLSSPTPTAPVAPLNSPAPAADDYFGESVAIDGTTVAIGASGAPGDGALYIYGPASQPADEDNDGLLDSWELTYWPTTAGHGPLDDFDGDRNIELLELAFGLNPTISDSGGQPDLTNEGGYLTMTVTKHPGVTYEVQSAGTLLPEQNDSFSPATTTVQLNTVTTLKVRDNVPIGTPPARFLRVQVTAAP